MPKDLKPKAKDVLRDIIGFHQSLAHMSTDEHLTNISQIRARSRRLMDEWNTISKKISKSQQGTTRYLIMAGTRELAHITAERLKLRPGSWKHLMRIQDLAGCRGHQVVYAEEFYADAELNEHVMGLIASGYLETYSD